jgi:hypothetical protein
MQGSVPRRRVELGGKPRAALLPVVLAILGVPAVVFAVDVRGTLTIPSDYRSNVAAPTPQESARARYWEEWNGVLDPRPARLDTVRELAVVLTGDGPPAGGEQPPYRIHNGSLLPATIVARAGTGIQIRNDDGMSYELFAEGNTDFAAIQTAPGNARPITFSQPGDWPVRDRVHVHVRGHVHALPNLIARAFLESNGSYTFRGVPAGTYQLRVFHGAREVASQEVHVADGSALQVPAITLSAAAAAAASQPRTPPATLPPATRPPATQ